MRIAVVVLLLGVVGCVSSAGPGRHSHSFLAPPAKPTSEAQAMAHYLAALMLERSGQLPESAQELRKASDLSPGSITLTVKLIRTYIRLDDMKNACLMCERAVETAPDKPWLWLVLGGIYQKLERFDDAKAALDKAIALEPNDPTAYQAVVEIQESVNDLVGAIDICRRLLELRPDTARLYVQLGVNLARINDSTGAAAALDRALQLDAGLIDARYLLGLVYMDLNENEKAVEQFTLYVKYRPDNAGAIENLAGVLARLDRRSEAAALLQAVSEGSGVDQASYVLQRVYLLLRMKKYAEADAIVPPNGAPIIGTLMRALVRRAKGDPYRSLLDSLDTVEGDIDGECQQFLARMMSLYGKADTGKFFLDQLTALKQEGVRSKYLDLILARTLILLDRNEEAESVLLNALKDFGSDRWAHFYLATVYETLHRYTDTEVHLKTCIEMDPDDPDLKNFLGYMYAEQNMKLDEAEALVQKALEAEPDNGAYMDSLGWVYFRKGDADRAIKLIRQAIMAMSSDDPVLRDHLGDAYLLKGEVDKAVAEWRHALRLDPKLEGVQEKLDRHPAAGTH